MCQPFFCLSGGLHHRRRTPTLGDSSCYKLLAQLKDKEEEEEEAVTQEGRKGMGSRQVK